MASVAPGTITITDNVGWWAKFLKRTHKKELAEISAHYPAIRSLTIDVRKVLDNKYAFEILSQPEKTIGYIQDAVQRENLIILSRGKVPEINVRFVNLPRKTPIRDIRQSDLGKAISVEGIARKVTDVRPRITSAVFRCSHCDRALPPVKQRTREFIEPDICPNCDRKGKFDLLLDNCSYIDAQKIRIQEAPEGLRGGQQAQSIDVDISDDLVAQVLPGDRVVVNGILRPVQKVTFGKKSPLFDLYLQANSLEVGETEFEDVVLSEEDEKEILALAQDPDIYNKMVSSIAPTVYGHEKVKAALLLALFGGVSKPMAGADLRGNIHVLILGDPGIAKSVILRYAVSVAPHGIFTTGKTSTGAGLTAAAVKDDFGDGRWTLEAGALVLADGGVCGVDELDKMRKDDRDALHEAMEQQRISISKAGITTSLRSRCSLLAAANPKYGRFSLMDPIADQIDLPPSLVSRFDLIFLIADVPSETTDARISDHILRTQRAGQARVRKAYRVADDEDAATLKETMDVDPLISPESLRKYISYARRFVFPALTEEANQILRDFYREMRMKASSDPDSPVPVTARQLEALVRLAEASARVRLSNKITAEDAERVTALTLSSLRQICTDDDGNIDVDLLMSGEGKGSRDLKTVIRSLLRQNEGSMRIDDLIESLVAQKFRRDRAERAVEELSQLGELIQPRPNVTVRLI